MTDAEIIEVLGGPTAVARMLDIKPPSVMGWLESGIPDGRLRDLAAQIELRSNGRFTRRERWPENYAFFWPELDQAHSTPIPELAEAQAEPAQAAIKSISPDASDAT